MMPREQMSVPPQFKSVLFQGVLAEDRAVYDDHSLDQIAALAFRHLSRHRSNGSDVQLADVEFLQGGRAQKRTVLQALNDDMPFLLDSTLAALADAGLEPLLVSHPVVYVERHPSGQLSRFLGEPIRPLSGAGRAESLIHIHLAPVDGEETRAKIVATLTRVYADCSLAFADWQRMTGEVDRTLEGYRANRPTSQDPAWAETVAFLEWIKKDNFIFLGTCRSDYDIERGEVRVDPAARLGLLRDDASRILGRSGAPAPFAPHSNEKPPSPLTVTKAAEKSPVHRRAYLDCINVQIPDAGRWAGDLLILGLFASSAYVPATSQVPCLRQKTASVMARAGLDPASHAGRVLANVLENYPRDELFEVDEDTLLEFSIEIIRLSERPRVRVLARTRREDSSIASILVFIPKEKYNTAVRRAVGELLAQEVGGSVLAADPSYPEGALARTHYLLHQEHRRNLQIDRPALEQKIWTLLRTWDECLRDLCVTQQPSGGGRLASRYSGAFSAGYREVYGPEQALADLEIFEGLSSAVPRAVQFTRREGEHELFLLRIFSTASTLPLSHRITLLENMGFTILNERTFKVCPRDASSPIGIYELPLQGTNPSGSTDDDLLCRLKDTLLKLFDAAIESDSFNKLVVCTSLQWRDVVLLRAFGRYLRQLERPYSLDSLAAALGRHPKITEGIVQLFHARFDPRPGSPTRRTSEVIRSELDILIRDVSALDDDRILRSFVNLVDATVRTNFFQQDESGAWRRTLAFKFVSQSIEGLPDPRPLFEMFVYAPEVEGIHLRFGKIARGGLRWSDRPHDYRREVLGLAKAQQAKNAVIIPVGAKGGFIARDIGAASLSGRDAYRVFIRTMLQMTDDVVAGTVVAPPLTVRYDGDDAYFVVAADKGTATFSDLANEIASECGHWLGDAFASGGSQGYDHKAMAITSRGAWECVQRHFREIGCDLRQSTVTVAGVGDMSGDVFGNGMLLSNRLKLIAAFDHRSIFLDPEPDPHTSWMERERLFKIPRSSWHDYDASFISVGGGVFARAAKSIPLSVEVRNSLQIDRAELSPDELITAILKAPVDLLWFGGIGTYVRGPTESEEQIGDRSNDRVRVLGSDLRARVLAEGANLACTQRGRIAAARKGVRLNTDAIDNSAGVNTSDIEVNIKIALVTAERCGKLTNDERKTLLDEMTEEVAQLATRNNYLQGLALSLCEYRGAAETRSIQRLIHWLEGRGQFDRSIHALPDDALLMERISQGEGLTRPEFAVLLAHAKLALYEDILSSRIPDDPYFSAELASYFPSAIRSRFPEEIASHKLKREIISCRLANALINRCGPASAAGPYDEPGITAHAVVAAYVVVSASFRLEELNEAIDALDSSVPIQEQLALYSEVKDVLSDRMDWLARNEDLGGLLARNVDRFSCAVSELEGVHGAALPDKMLEEIRSRESDLKAMGVPIDLARRIASLRYISPTPEILSIADSTGSSLSVVATAYFETQDLLRLPAVFNAARSVSIASDFDQLALDSTLEAIGRSHRELVAEIVNQGGQPSSVDAWAGRRSRQLGAFVRTAESLGLQPTIAKVVVLERLLANLRAVVGQPLRALAG